MKFASKRKFLSVLLSTVLFGSMLLFGPAHTVSAAPSDKYAALFASFDRISDSYKA